MLSRDGLALSPGLFPRSALCLPTCFLLSPHLFPRALAGLDAVTSWSGSVSALSPRLFSFVSPLGSSRACWAGCCHEMVWLGQLFASPLVSSLACWAGCCHKMVWLGQPLIPRLVCICLPPCFLTRLLGWMLPPLVSSRACWAGRCHELVWLGQLFVSPLVSFCLPTCFLTRLLGWVLSRDGLARSALCLPHLFSHSLAGLEAVTRWSGSVSPLSPHLFAFVSPLGGRVPCLPISCMGRRVHSLCLPSLVSSPSLDAWHGSLGGRVHLPFICLLPGCLARLSGFICLPLSPFISPVVSQPGGGRLCLPSFVSRCLPFICLPLSWHGSLRLHLPPVVTQAASARLRNQACVHARTLARYRTRVPDLSSCAVLKREGRQQQMCSNAMRAGFTTASFWFIRVEAQTATSCWHVCACPSVLNCLGSLLV